MIIRSRAPMRISLGGGGTDVSPYIEEHGGIVLNTTINKYAYASLVPKDGESINIKSLDYKIDLSFSINEVPTYNGELDLVKAVIKTLNISQGFDLILRSDVPPGAGLGASSTLTTALIGAFKHWKNLVYTDYELAELAYQIERKEVGITGGKQDQYASVFGGVNYIEFYADKTIVHPLRIKSETLNELEYRMLLCYTGRSHISSEIIKDQVNNYVENRQDTRKALDETKKLAIEIKNSLVLGKFDEVGYLLDEGWRIKKIFSDKITSPFVDELYETAKKNGATGGKLLGAGGGGHLLFICNENKRYQVVEALEKAGAQITPFAFVYTGLQSWRIEN
jgi:D-glycero-alpha-D-manno-heptose-7-phosphate kinase